MHSNGQMDVYSTFGCPLLLALDWSRWLVISLIDESGHNQTLPTMGGADALGRQHLYSLGLDYHNRPVLFYLPGTSGIRVKQDVCGLCLTVFVQYPPTHTHTHLPG